MAQHVNVKFVDDLDGSEASDTIFFGLEGRHYEIDLSDENAAKLRDTLASFVGAARKSGGRSFTSSRPRASRPATADREHTATIRQWARDNGHNISERGRIPGTVLQAYQERASAPQPDTEAPKKAKKRASKVANPDKAAKQAS